MKALLGYRPVAFLFLEYFIVVVGTGVTVVGASNVLFFSLIDDEMSVGLCRTRCSVPGSRG